MSGQMVRLERALDASPERVFRMWSDPESLASWLTREVRGSLLPGARSTLVWRERSAWIEVLEVEPEHHFRFRWGRGDAEGSGTLVDVELRPRGLGTALTLTDGPYDVGEPGGLEACLEAAALWGEALANLRAQVDFSVDLRQRGR